MAGWHLHALSGLGLLWWFRQRRQRAACDHEGSARVKYEHAHASAPRHVVCADAVEWIRKLGEVNVGLSRPGSLGIPDSFDLKRCSIVVSMPDFSETPFSEGLRAASGERAFVEAAAIAAYKDWFVDTACDIFQAL